MLDWELHRLGEEVLAAAFAQVVGLAAQDRGHTAAHLLGLDR